MHSAPGTDTAAGVEPIAVGSVLGGRYRLTARIGAGGMATIFRAVDETLERVVAVKVLHAHLADDPALLSRFRTEARHAAALLHPHIVNVFDQGVAGLPYIVMEHVDGPSLREVLVRRGRLSPAEVLTVAEPVARALARAHAAGVIHRDVKPENVLVAADGTPKVADFGVARVIADTSHTATGTLIGSVHYMAPELVDGAGATERSDQYSLGVVLYELLTGRKPLPADSPMAVALRHAREPVPPPSAVAPEVPGALDDVVATATALDPARRFDDLPELVRALRAAVPGGPRPVVVEGPPQAADSTLVIPAGELETAAVPAPSVAAARRRGARAGGPAGASASAGAKRPARSPARRLAMLALLAAVVAAAALAGWHYVLAPVTDVPSLAGSAEAAAAEAVADRGLELVVAGRRHSRSRAEGTVLTQEPAPGSALRAGGEVTVVVSQGPAPVEVPAVEGRPAGATVERLRGPPWFFDVEIRRAFSDTVRRGRVIGSEPAAGEALRQGDTVTLTVSRGIEQVEVPRVAGDAREAAVAALEGAGLRVEVAEQFSDEVPAAGTVIAQDVPAGRSVDKGATVGLTVSKGPLTVAMPPLVGSGLRQSRAALAELGLAVNVEEQARPQIGPTRQGEYGRVEAQVPGPGTQVRRGDTVTVYTFSASADARAGG